MKTNLFLLLPVVSLMLLLSCTENSEKQPQQSSLAIQGTWKLITGTTISKGDTTVTFYTGDTSFIKIINDSYFSFLQHDVNKGKDTATAFFAAGGGHYSLIDSLYTEHLEYCSARNWEGHDFTFVVKIANDTLTQKGVEKLKEAGINRINIEKYVRLKD